MSLIYDEAQEAMITQARRVLEARIAIASLLPLIEARGDYHADYWRTAREQGWCGIAVPEEFGGLGLTLVEQGALALQIGRSIAGAPFLTGSWGLARALAVSGDDPVRHHWLPLLASGEAIGAVAFAQAQDPLPRQPALSFSGGKLTGTVAAVSGGGHADVALLLASEGAEPVLVLAPLKDAERRLLNTWDNSRCTADLIFTGHPATVLERSDAATSLARDVLAAQAVIAAHEQTGGAEALMEAARDYAVTRRAFGQPIGAFQSVKHRIAELYVAVELARAGAVHAAASDGTDGFIGAAAAARIQATDAYDTAARDAVQVHGGIGVTWEAGLHLHTRRARTLAIEQGNLLFWEDLLVDELERQMAGAAA